MAIFSKENFFLKSLRVQIPAMLCLEHLHSEYSSLIHDKKIEFSKNDEEFITNLFNDREKKPPTWHDLYRFELILANHLPSSKLRGKVVRLRYEFRSIAGQKEFDDYIASKPPDLQSPPNRETEPDKHEDYRKLLREDLKDLLDRLYMRYAILPVKEKKLNRLTFVAAGLCLASLLVLLGIVVYLFACPIGKPCFSPEAVGDISSLTILVVVVTGAMGGFVSALQRIQKPSVDGDSVYNLSVLFYGSNSVFVAPVTGAIFAILLYLMFTSQVLRGTFFPEIYTPRAQRISQNGDVSGGGSRRREPSSESGATKVAAPNLPTNENANKTDVEDSQTIGSGNEVSASPVVGAASTSPTPTRTPLPPTPEPVAVDSLKVVDFLAKSGPAGGKDFALLILWCFIAGFAERFVPDALDRFIKRSDQGDGSKT